MKSIWRKGGADPRSFVLPWPPSVNAIWRSIVIKGSVRVLLSKEGRKYREGVQKLIGQVPTIAQPVEVRIAAYPPDGRRRDIDNIAKAALDALTHAGVWDDDVRVAVLHVSRCPPVPGGRLIVTVNPIASTPAAAPPLIPAALPTPA